MRTVTLTATAGVWTNSPSAIAYQWLRCNPDRTGCQTIPGATTASYSLALADEGHAVTVQVTATNTSGSGTATARGTSAVSAAPPSVIHAPAVTGAAYQQDVPLSVVPNSAVWQDTPDTTYAATWRRCDADGTNCQTIGGANATGYTPSRSDVGHALVLAITATNPDGSATAASTPTQVIVPAPPRWRTLPLLSSDPGARRGRAEHHPGRLVRNAGEFRRRADDALHERVLRGWRGERDQLHDHERGPRRHPPGA